MAEDKKKSSLFGKLLNKKASGNSYVAPEEQLPDDFGVELNADPEGVEAESDSTPEWLSDVITEDAEADPDEDISEALAELFGDNKEEDSGKLPALLFPDSNSLPQRVWKIILNTIPRSAKKMLNLLKLRKCRCPNTRPR